MHKSFSGKDVDGKISCSYSLLCSIHCGEETAYFNMYIMGKRYLNLCAL